MAGDIWIVRIAGGVARALTRTSGIALNYHATFLPDGSQVACIASGPEVSPDGRYIYYDEVMNLGGGDWDPPRTAAEVDGASLNYSLSAGRADRADRVNAEWEVTSGTSAAPD